MEECLWLITWQGLDGMELGELRKNTQCLQEINNMKQWIVSTYEAGILGMKRRAEVYCYSYQGQGRENIDGKEKRDSGRERERVEGK